MDLHFLAVATRRVADHPSHGVTSRDGDEPLTRLERDVGHLIDGGIELVERTLGVGIDLDGIDITVLDRLDARRGVGTRHPLRRRAGILLLVGLLADGLELAGKRKWRRHLDIADGRLRFRLAPGGQGRTVEDGDLRYLDAGGASTEATRHNECNCNRTQRAHLDSPVVTSWDQLKACT